MEIKTEFEVPRKKVYLSVNMILYTMVSPTKERRFDENTSVSRIATTHFIYSPTICETDVIMWIVVDVYTHMPVYK